MKQTTKNAVKVGFGSCVAALVCYLCALWLAPAFKVLALVAGFCAGWLAYEFRNVLRAIPDAASAAWHETKHILEGLWSRMKRGGRRILNTQPEIAMSIILAAITVTIMLFAFNCGRPIFKGTDEPYMITKIIIYAVVYILLGSIPMLIFTVATCVLNVVGWEHYKIELYSLSKYDLDPRVTYIDYDKLPNKERWKMCLCGIYLGIWQLFYGIGWLLYKAVYWAAAIVFCYLWVGLAYAIWYTGKAILWALSFALAFIVNLIIAVHKKERLICGIDGALGGMFAWLYLAPTWSTNLADHLVPILCGMALGAAFGLFNYWVIAVKLLKTLPRERPAPAR